MPVEREFVTLIADDGGAYDGLFHHEPHSTRVRERRTGRRTAQIHVHGIMGNFLVGTLRFLPSPYARIGVPMLVAETRMGNVGQLFGDAIPEEGLLDLDAAVKWLLEEGYDNLLTATRDQLDLRDQATGDPAEQGAPEPRIGDVGVPAMLGGADGAHGAARLVAHHA